MGWARISDDFHDHPKVAELTVDMEGIAALGLWTLALSWVRADRRRKGIVPAGIAMRLSSGNGKQLASRLVDAGLWDEVSGGWRFHDFDDIYTPEELAAKRAEAGRQGGLKSGQTRRAKAAKQSASESKQRASFASIGDDPESIINADATGENPAHPIEANRILLRSDSDTSDNLLRQTDEMDMAPDQGEQEPSKQNRSNVLQERSKPSHARAGATTHYPLPISGTGPYQPHGRNAHDSRPAEPPPPERIVIDATGATPDEAAAIAKRVRNERQPRSLPGLLRRMAADGDLADLLAEQRAAARKAEVAAQLEQIRKMPPCNHGTAGGDQPHPTSGKPLCPFCRRDQNLIQLPVRPAHEESA